jgi:hypothetical protein
MLAAIRAGLKIKRYFVCRQVCRQAHATTIVSSDQY